MSTGEASPPIPLQIAVLPNATAERNAVLPADGY